MYQTNVGISTMYAFEGIPSTLTAEQVHTVAEFARTPNGLRRFALVMLLSEYGPRILQEAQLVKN
jgi:hypothetical protein